MFKKKKQRRRYWKTSNERILIMEMAYLLSYFPKHEVVTMNN